MSKGFGLETRVEKNGFVEAACVNCARHRFVESKMAFDLSAWSLFKRLLLPNPR